MSFRFKATSRFERSVRKLAKRYPKIKSDLAIAFEQIEATPAVGTIIPEDYAIRKLRIASSDMKRGKSGGFRLLYKLLEDNKSLAAVLLYVYAKSDQADVSPAFLETLMDDTPDDEESE